MITEASIKSALRNVTTSGKSRIELKDDGERGTGRLTLLVRQLKNGVTAEWYAMFWRDGKRQMIKLGSYPTMSLADARKRFREDYAPAISTGSEPPPNPRVARARERKTPTIKEMLEGYVQYLEQAEKVSAKAVRNALLGKTGCVHTFGGDRLAKDITPEDIVDHLAPIHDRGAICMAKDVRAYLSAAFSWAIKARHDYRNRSACIDWGVTQNPVKSVPFDPEAVRAGQRFLKPEELCTLWRWLEQHDGDRLGAPVCRLMLATGQRAVEIMKLTTTHYSRDEAMLDWSKTKNGRPHSIPLPKIAVNIMENLVSNSHGLYFPSRLDGQVPASWNVLQFMIDAFRKEHPEIEHFTVRDFRRTWKTLAGVAGVSKEMRDMLQNHARGDVSSRHYDRYNYLPERKAAMEKWNDYLAGVLSQPCRRTSQVRSEEAQSTNNMAA